ncbi:hypothetical protein M5689_012145 [Euphorbia peplus]|nr:hypothetical protein M5689_012145 [Euphorbia peplus]
MATITTSPEHVLQLPSRGCLRAGGLAASFTRRACFHKPAYALGPKLYSQCSYVFVAEPCCNNNFRRLSWKIRSNIDSGGLDPSPSSNSNGRTRLVRAIQDLQSKIVARIKELRKNLPLKLLFLLVGFYCATAFSTVIGQTGDWDILSAALAVAVVEGIGALMYRATLPVFNRIRSLITMFNYWKAGLSLGLFLDSFKYEMGDIMNFSNPLHFEMDPFSPFL